MIGRSIMATVRTDQKQRVLMRAVPHSFSEAIAAYFGSGPTDIALAKTQHAAYVQALLDIGLEVTILPADNDHPDCIFVEDQAIVIDGHVLLPVWPPSRSLNNRQLLISSHANSMDSKSVACLEMLEWTVAIFCALVTFSS